MPGVCWVHVDLLFFFDGKVTLLGKLVICFSDLVNVSRIQDQSKFHVAV